MFFFAVSLCTLYKKFYLQQKITRPEVRNKRKAAFQNQIYIFKEKFKKQTL